MNPAGITVIQNAILASKVGPVKRNMLTKAIDARIHNVVSIFLIIFDFLSSQIKCELLQSSPLFQLQLNSNSFYFHLPLIYRIGHPIKNKEIHQSKNSGN